MPNGRSRFSRNLVHRNSLRPRKSWRSVRRRLIDPVMTSADTRPDSHLAYVPVITMTHDRSQHAGFCKITNRRVLFRTVAAFILAAVCIERLMSQSLAADAAPSRGPNIVLIMADDFGFECVTANGGESYRTPNLDQLAAGGMRFEHCHVQPLCTPTRSQLMTGLSNVRNYVDFGVLTRDQRTFGHLLQEAGYVTGICGKWQLGHELDSPQHFGFEESYLWQHTRRPPRYANPGLEHNGQALDFNSGEYGPELVNKFALDFIDRHRDEPFFLYYPMILTHDPYQPTPDSDDWDPAAEGEKVHVAKKHFADMTAYMDKMVGRVVSKLKEQKLQDKTLLIFLGDNGTGRGTVSQFKGQEYKGGKGQTDARGTHVPLIVSWPGTVPAGKVNGDLISSCDFLPTLCDAARISKPDLTDGISFYPQLRGEAGTPRESIYTWYWPRPAEVLKECAFNHTGKLYRDGTYFDLTTDPFEEQPLDRSAWSAEQHSNARKLQATLSSFDSARSQDLPKPNTKESGKKRKANAPE